MTLLTSYSLDRETIKLNAYRLLCHFYASKQIARLSDPQKRADPASKLELSYFAREVSQLLLSIAISLRVLDDQMAEMPAESSERLRYFRARERVNRGFHCMMFDTLSLREVCNKIIHATVVEPHTEEGQEAHELDEYNAIVWEEIAITSQEAVSEPEPTKWQHLSSRIRLGGKKDGKEWWHLLEVPTFVWLAPNLRTARNLRFRHVKPPAVVRGSTLRPAVCTPVDCAAGSHYKSAAISR